MNRTSTSDGEAASSFRGEIVVASRIVDYLSSGLYNSPAACLKELINNSYDADASEVKVFVQPDADRIIIYDDGVGMDRADFEKNFQRIAETQKRSISDTTPRGRPKIGKIGIGFIAANEICDVMHIESTKTGSGELIDVSINFDKMREDPAARKRGGGDYAKGDYEGKVTTAPKSHHYTRVTLKGVRGEARRILIGQTRPPVSGEPLRSLYGLARLSVERELRQGDLTSWDELDPYSETTNWSAS